MKQQLGLAVVYTELLWGQCVLAVRRRQKCHLLYHHRYDMDPFYRPNPILSMDVSNPCPTLCHHSHPFITYLKNLHMNIYLKFGNTWDFNFNPA